MAIVTGGDTMMAGGQPCVELLSHYVAILARRGIIAPIGESLGEVKREQAKAEERPDADDKSPN